MKRKCLNLAADFFLSIIAAVVVVSWIGLAPVRADGGESLAGTCSVNTASTACNDDSCTANGNLCYFTAATGTAAASCNCR